jgi:GH24 family phage-related lysozyme (muramidase)
MFADRLWPAFGVCILASAGSVAAADLDSDKLRTQLIRHEGKRAKVYKDTEGVPTVGVGFNLNRADARQKLAAVGADLDKVKAGQQELTEDQIRKLLDADMDTAVADCKALFPKFAELSDVRQRALADMMFNLGRARLSGFKKMVSHVNAGEFDKAAGEMKASKWYAQVKDRGKTLEAMVRTNKDPK